MSNTCIIIGSEGYLGKHIVHYASAYGYEIVGCYDVVEHGKSYPYTGLDLTDKENLFKINPDVDFIFLFAGMTGTYAGFDCFEKYVSVNEIGLLNLLDYLRTSGSRAKVIFPSTRLVYKGIDQPLTEEAEKEAKTIYAVNKLACEAYLSAYSKVFGIPYTVYRICVPYGNEISGDYSFGTVGFFLRCAQKGRPVTLYGGGEMKRTFSHVADICHIILSTAKLSATDNEIYNIGGETKTLRQVAELVNRNYGVNIKSVEWPEKDLKIESGHTYFDSRKIDSLLPGYKYHSLEEIEF